MLASRGVSWTDSPSPPFLGPSRRRRPFAAVQGCRSLLAELFGSRSPRAARRRRREGPHPPRPDRLLALLSAALELLSVCWVPCQWSAAPAVRFGVGPVRVLFRPRTVQEPGAAGCGAPSVRRLPLRRGSPLRLCLSSLRAGSPPQPGRLGGYRCRKGLDDDDTAGSAGSGTDAAVPAAAPMMATALAVPAALAAAPMQGVKNRAASQVGCKG